MRRKKDQLVLYALNGSFQQKSKNSRTNIYLFDIVPTIDKFKRNNPKYRSQRNTPNVSVQYSGSAFRAKLVKSKFNLFSGLLLQNTL